MSDRATDPTTDLQTGDDLAKKALQATNDEVAQSNQVAETVLSLQSIIERNADQLDRLKKDLKSLREQLRSVFENDVELGAAEEQYESFRLQIKERKAKLQQDPTVVRLKTQIGELSQAKKEIEEALSNHLVNYYQLTNSTSFDTSDGDQREFQIKAFVKSKRG